MIASGTIATTTIGVLYTMRPAVHSASIEKFAVLVILKITIKSTVSISLANLLMMRPVGVISKKYAGERRMLNNSVSCMTEDAR